MPQQPKSKEKEGIQVLTIISKLIKSIQTYPKLYLFILYFLLIIAPLIGNIFSGNVLLKGEESYYHINQAKSITIHNWQYTPLYLAHKYLPLNALALLPRILGLITIYYLYLTLKKIHPNQNHQLIFLSLLMISPLFLYAFRTLSSIGLFLCLTSIGFYLFFLKHDLTKVSTNIYSTNISNSLSKQPSIQNISLLSVIPFLVASSLEGSTTLFLLFIIIILYIFYHKETNFPKHTCWILLLSVSLSFIIHQTLLPQSFFSSPFIEQNQWNDAITDFGGIQGMGIFMFILGIIGFILLRKQHTLFYSTLLFLLVTIPLYIFNTSIVTSIGIWFIFISSVALNYLVERTWTLQKLKNFTILVIILGLIFSTMTYSLRLSTRSPTPADVEVLSWVKDNLPKEQIIFTSPSIGNYVSYYSKHPVVSTLQNSAEIRGNLTQKIYSTAYITELFPLLEGYDISLLYITPEMREFLPNDQNLLFLLKNERFKLVYSTQDTEMWLFTNKSSTQE